MMVVIPFFPFGQLVYGWWSMRYDVKVIRNPVGV